MTTRSGVRFLGIILIAMGALGLLPFPDINPVHSNGIGVRYLLNLMAVNALHNGLHLALGLWALWSARREIRARSWAIGAGGILIFLSFAGAVQAAFEAFPVDQLLFGAVALNLPGHLFHFVTGCTALWIGIAAPDTQKSGTSLFGETPDQRSGS